MKETENQLPAMPVCPRDKDGREEMSNKEARDQETKDGNHSSDKTKKSQMGL